MRIFPPGFLVFLLITTMTGTVLGMEDGQKDVSPYQDNSILRFNIGGYYFDTTYNTIKLGGGEYLNTLLSGKFAITYDEDGRIFIDKSKQEGELIDFFIRNLELPANFDRTTAIRAAKFFGITSIQEHIDNLDNLNRPSMSKIKHVNYNLSRYSSSFKCSECEQKINYHRGEIRIEMLKRIMQHLLDTHDAKILTLYHHESSFRKTLFYQLPAESKN